MYTPCFFHADFLLIPFYLRGVRLPVDLGAPVNIALCLIIMHCSHGKETKWTDGLTRGRHESVNS